MKENLSICNDNDFYEIMKMKDIKIILENTEFTFGELETLFNVPDDELDENSKKRKQQIIEDVKKANIELEKLEKSCQENEKKWRKLEKKLTKQVEQMEQIAQRWEKLCGEDKYE